MSPNAFSLGSQAYGNKYIYTDCMGAPFCELFLVYLENSKQDLKKMPFVKRKTTKSRLRSEKNLIVLKPRLCKVVWEFATLIARIQCS